MLRLVALAALIAVGSATTAKLELQLLAQAADCQTVNIPASDVASMLEVRSDPQNSEDLTNERGVNKVGNPGNPNPGQNDADWIDPLSVEEGGDPAKQGNGFMPPVTTSMDRNSPSNAVNSFGVFSPGTTPHVKLSIGALPERDRGTPEIVSKEDGPTTGGMGGGPQIMFSDNEMDVQTQRLYAISVLRILGSQAANSTCYCHYSDKKNTQEAFNEMNCLCKNRQDKPLCRLEEIFDKYAEANLHEVVAAAKERTEKLLAASGLQSPEPAGAVHAEGSAEAALHSMNSNKPLTAKEKCAAKPCKHACMLHGVCLCGACICEPGLKGDDCSIGLKGANFFTPKVKAEPIGKAAGNPADSSHPEHTVLIQDNPLLHNNKDQ